MQSNQIPPTKYHQPNRPALFKLLAHVQWSATSDMKFKKAKASTAKQPAKKSMKKRARHQSRETLANDRLLMEAMMPTATMM